MNTSFRGPALLFCPGDRPDRFPKALSRADTVILDLEDAIGPDHKESARDAVSAFAKAADPTRVIVRVNAAETPWFADDVAAMRTAGVRNLMLPKAGRVEDLDALTGFDVVALCETADGVLAAQQVAQMPNCGALMWGGEDLIAGIGGRASRSPRGRYHAVVEQARSTVLLAAAAAGIPAIDAVHIVIDDYEGLERESGEAVDVGFAAKACIHPSHVEIIRAAFRPTDDQIIWAQEVLANPRAAIGGVFRHRDQMIDGPLLTHARTIVERTTTCSSS